jgi:hypothetical protein
MGHIMENVAIEIQNVAGSSVSFGKTRSTGEPGMYNRVYQYKQRDASRRCFDNWLPVVDAYRTF